jgi:hypothetical protein
MPEQTMPPINIPIIPDNKNIYIKILNVPTPPATLPPLPPRII